MSVLNKDAINRAIDHGLVTGIIHQRTQVQPAGIELTLEKVERLETSGSVAFDKSETSTPRLEELEFTGIGGYLRVMPGAYLVTFNETVKLPSDMMALGITRTEALYAGVTVELPVIPPGFEDKPKGLLVVTNPKGFAVKKDARMVQLIFISTA